MAKLEKATFAGGCFWCIEDAFRSLKGVVEAVSGYTGGHEENPTYEDVCSRETGHYEAVQVTFDPTKISYEKLLGHFWSQIDPTDQGGQFTDRGSQYRTAIFYHSNEQRKKAEESKKRLENSGKLGKPIATKIIEFKKFYKAEEYHQDYSEKNPSHYSAYKEGSGRACYIKKMRDG
jgi:peptide methionine sulfoxide reductase msrA/msrB